MEAHNEGRLHIYHAPSLCHSISSVVDLWYESSSIRVNVCSNGAAIPLVH